jgi:hypothetical protein
MFEALADLFALPNERFWAIILVVLVYLVVRYKRNNKPAT